MASLPPPHGPKRAKEKLQFLPKATRKEDCSEDGEDSPQETLASLVSGRQTFRSQHIVNSTPDEDEPHAAPRPNSFRSSHIVNSSSGEDQPCARPRRNNFRSQHIINSSDEGGPGSEPLRHKSQPNDVDASEPSFELTHPRYEAVAASSRSKKALRAASTASRISGIAGETAMAQTDVAGNHPERIPRSKKKIASHAPNEHALRRSERTAQIEPEFSGLEHSRGSFTAQTARKPRTQLSQGGSFGGQAQLAQGDWDGDSDDDDDEGEEDVKKPTSALFPENPTRNSAIQAIVRKTRTLRSNSNCKSANNRTRSSPSLGSPAARTTHTLPSASSLKSPAAQASSLPSRTSLGANTPKTLRNPSPSKHIGNQASLSSPPLASLSAQAEVKAPTQHNQDSTPSRNWKKSLRPLRSTLPPKTTIAQTSSTALSFVPRATRIMRSGTNSSKGIAGVDSDNSEASDPSAYRKLPRNNSISPVASPAGPAARYPVSSLQRTQGNLSNRSAPTHADVNDFVRGDSATLLHNQTGTRVTDRRAMRRPRSASSKRASSANKDSRKGPTVAAEIASMDLDSDFVDLPAQPTSDVAADALTLPTGRVTRSRSLFDQSAAKIPDLHSQASSSIVAETPRTDPEMNDNDFTETSLTGLGHSDNTSSRRPTRAAAAKGRAKTRLMAGHLEAGSGDANLDEETYWELIRENQSPALMSPKPISKNREPLSKFKWNLSIGEELGSPAFKRKHAKEIQEVRVNRDIAGKFDPHTPERVQAQKEKYALRVKRAMEQWPTSNVRGAQDPEALVKNKLREMLREAELKNRLEEEAEEQAERAKHGQVNKNHEELNHDSDATEQGPDDAAGQEGAHQEGPADEEEPDEDTTRTHPDIPRSFNEEFRLRQAAAASVASQPPPSKEPSSSNSFLGIPPSLSNNHTPLATNQAFSFGSNPAISFGSNPPSYSINNLPPSINDRAAQEAAFAVDFPWKQPGATYFRAPDEALSQIRARKEHARKTAEELKDEKDAIEAADILTDLSNGPRPFQPPFRTHDFDYHNLVASGRIGGPQAAATPTQQPQPRGPYQRAAKEGETRDEYNDRITDMMTNHLGLQLEPTPPLGECFPPLTGPWPELPGQLTGLSNPFQRAPSYGQGSSGVVPGASDVPATPGALGALGNLDEQQGLQHEAQRGSDSPAQLDQN